MLGCSTRYHTCARTHARRHLPQRDDMLTLIVCAGFEAAVVVLNKCEHAAAVLADLVRNYAPSLTVIVCPPSPHAD